MNKNKVLAAVMATILVVSAAVAATLAQVTSDAEALKSDYQTLLARMDACPGGQCSDAADIVSAYQADHARLAQLHSDRDSLGGSSASLDSLIRDIDVMDTQATGTVGGWEDGL